MRALAQIIPVGRPRSETRARQPQGPLCASIALVQLPAQQLCCVTSWSHPLRTVALLTALLSSISTLSRAEEASCILENGVPVVSASVAGVAGDYIFDTGEPVTKLHDTRAMGAGLAEGPQAADILFAGLRWTSALITTGDLDARTAAFTTPIAGVLGSDLLRHLSVEIRLEPSCRIRLDLPGQMNPWRGPSAPLGLDATGRPLITAGVSDGGHAWRGLFVLSTGLEAPLALASDTVTTRGGETGSLRAASFQGKLLENLGATVVVRDRFPGAAGALGSSFLSSGEWQIDFVRGELRHRPRSP